MKEWLDLVEETPSETWASYDGEQIEICLSRPLCDDLGFTSVDEIIAYRTN